MFRVQTIYFYTPRRSTKMNLYASLIEYVLFPTCDFALCFFTIHVN